MNTHDLIDNLKTAPEGSRSLDAAIAKALGWTLKIVDDDSAKGRRFVWSNGQPTEKPPMVPHYSTNMQDALELCKEVKPGHVGAVVWEGDRCRASLGEGRQQCVGRTPALALCAAALDHLMAARS